MLQQQQQLGEIAAKMCLGRLRGQWGGMGQQWDGSGTAVGWQSGQGRLGIMHMDARNQSAIAGQTCLQLAQGPLASKRLV